MSPMLTSWVPASDCGVDWYTNHMGIQGLQSYTEQRGDLHVRVNLSEVALQNFQNTGQHLIVS